VIRIWIRIRIRCGSASQRHFCEAWKLHLRISILGLGVPRCSSTPNFTSSVSPWKFVYCFTIGRIYIDHRLILDAIFNAIWAWPIQLNYNTNTTAERRTILDQPSEGARRVLGLLLQKRRAQRTICVNIEVVSVLPLFFFIKYILRIFAEDPFENWMIDHCLRIVNTYSSWI